MTTNVNTSEGSFVIVDCVRTIHTSYVVRVLPGQTEEDAKQVALGDQARKFSERLVEERAVNSRFAEADEIIAVARRDNKFVASWEDCDIVERLVTPACHKYPVNAQPKPR